MLSMPSPGPPALAGATPGRPLPAAAGVTMLAEGKIPAEAEAEAEGD